MASTLSAESLSAFFDVVRPLFTEKLPEDRLSILLCRLRDVFREIKVIAPSVHPGKNIDENALQRLLSALPDPLEKAKRAGLLCNPWEIASLNRDELRNSKVLAWLLNPRGSHGFGCLLLDELLKEVDKHLQVDFSTTRTSYIGVRTESCPDGDQGNRVDIEIDAPAFYLIIEIKIYAPLGDKQLERYGQIASARARERPWAILYLTPHGKLPTEPGKWHERVVPISWKKIASLFSNALRSRYKAHSTEGKVIDVHQRVTTLLASSFINHIRKF